jgi:Fe-S-cluster containining protein
MIEPAKIKEAFNKIEDENYEFRTYLKSRADIDKLDRQFLELHKELFLNYDCSKCRNCCTEYSASFEKYELSKVADFLKIPEKEFMDKYIDEDFGEYQLKQRPCSFLKKDGNCEIEECKPESCKGYPFTDRPERIFSLFSIIESTSVCPVVFEMVERLKKEYRFKRRR